MQNVKEGIVIPFSGNLKNEDAKANMNNIANVASINSNVDSYVIHDEEIKKIDKLGKEIKINDELFLSVYSELITPIDIIYGAAQLMELHFKNTFDNDERADKSVNSIKQNCLRLTKLINNLLDLTRIEANQYSLNLSNVNIVEIVENIVLNSSFIINERQLNVIFDANVEEKIVLCDAEKIKKVVLYILLDVVKLSKPGENICVSVTAKDDSLEIAVSNESKKTNEEDILYRTYVKENKIDFLLLKSVLELHGGVLIENNQVYEGKKIAIELPCKNTDSIYYLNNKTSAVNHDNLITAISIELSDLIDTGWK
ncbi:MAG: HAMP domain-containing sensor histidine kinase [Sedimentibacter sp.]